MQKPKPVALGGALHIRLLTGLTRFADVATVAPNAAGSGAI
jgi:hypothetical protein